MGTSMGGENIGSESQRGWVKPWEGWGAGVEVPKPHKKGEKVLWGEDGTPKGGKGGARSGVKTPQGVKGNPKVG